MHRDELTAYLDRLLNIRLVSEDSANGLQVEGKDQVRRVGCAVDFSLDLVERAVREEIDFLFVHHGLIWGGLRSITGLTARLLKPMLAHGISLYAAHLPLDAHPELGHAACLAKRAGLVNARAFGDYKGIPVGITGEFASARGREDVLSNLQTCLCLDLQFFSFGKRKVRQMAIISGRGSFAWPQVVAAGADFFLTGEPSHADYHGLKASGLNVCFAGHYQTEKPGVEAVSAHLNGNRLAESIFFDIPSPF